MSDDLVPTPEAVGLDVGGKVEVRPNGLLFNEPLTLEEYSALFGTLELIGGAIQWWVGDALVYGELRGDWGETYTQAISETGFAYGTLANYVYTSKNVPFSRRNENLKWSHHYAVASLPAEQQVHWLEQAAAGGWTKNKLLAEMNGGPPAEVDEEPAVLPVWEAEFDSLTALIQALTVAPLPQSGRVRVLLTFLDGMKISAGLLPPTPPLLETTTTTPESIDSKDSEVVVVVVEESQEEQPTSFQLWVQLWESYCGLVTEGLAEHFRDLADAYPRQWLAEAFAEAAQSSSNGRFNLKYVLKILDRWGREGRYPRQRSGHPDVVQPDADEKELQRRLFREARERGKL